MFKKTRGALALNKFMDKYLMSDSCKTLEITGLTEYSMRLDTVSLTASVMVRGTLIELNQSDGHPLMQYCRNPLLGSNDDIVMTITSKELHKIIADLVKDVKEREE